MLNRADLYACIATFLTILMGIFYIDNLDPDLEFMAIIIFVVIILLNISYILYWIALIGPIVKKLSLDSFK